MVWWCRHFGGDFDPALKRWKCLRMSGADAPITTYMTHHFSRCLKKMWKIETDTFKVTKQALQNAWQFFPPKFVSQGRSVLRLYKVGRYAACASSHSRKCTHILVVIFPPTSLTIDVRIYLLRTSHSTPTMTTKDSASKTQWWMILRTRRLHHRHHGVEA